MASYKVVVKSSAERDLRSLPKSAIGRVYKWFEALQADPFPSQAVRLIGTKTRYRIRVGDYRIVYDVDKTLKQVTIHYVRHRRDVYR